MWIAAVDGGGTKTTAVVADHHGHSVGFGHAGCGNYQVCGLDTAIQNIQSALGSALAEARVRQQDIDYVQFSLAGADGPRDEKVLTPGLTALGLGSWGLVSDAWSSLRLGTVDGVGAAVVCGSGTNCVAKSRDGTQVQIGGYGYLFGDCAGGTDLAQQAFHRAVRSFEGREQPTLLTQLIPDFFKCSDMEALLSKALDEGWTEVPGELAVIVHHAANQGDPTAQSMLAQVGVELGRAAIAAVHKLGYAHLTLEPLRADVAVKSMVRVVPVVLTGSILQKGRSQILLKSLFDHVAGHQFNVELRLPRQEPVYGALLMAADQAGYDLASPAWGTVCRDGTIADTEHV